MRRLDRRHSSPVLRGKRILIVEDEAVVAMLIEDELTEVGVEIVGPAPSVNEALRLIEHAAWDGGLNAAVLDMNLEDGVVLPVADHLAALGVPFVFATGYDSDCDRGSHATSPILMKPFDPDALVAVIEGLVAKS